MTGPVFVDTNVFVYLRDSTEPDKQRRCAEWIGHLWETGRGRTSGQVLQEYHVTVTSKLQPGMPAEDARADVLALAAWNPLFPGADILEDACRTPQATGRCDDQRIPRRTPSLHPGALAG